MGLGEKTASPKGSVSAWLLPLPFDKVGPGSSPPVFTTDTAKISYCLSIAFQTQAEGLYTESRVIMTFISL